MGIDINDTRFFIDCNHKTFIELLNSIMEIRL